MAVTYRLCGGTFFTLMVEARKDTYKANQHYTGLRDGISEPELLFALGKLIKPDLPPLTESIMTTVKSNTTNYKQCKNKGGSYFPFKDQAALHNYDNRIREGDPALYTEMQLLIDQFLDTESFTNRARILVRALFDVIEKDDSIPAEQPFYIQENGKPVSKEKLLHMDTVCLEPFLAGIWHFAVCRDEPCTIGQETYHIWCRGGNGRRVFVSDIGQNGRYDVEYTRRNKEADDSSAERKSKKRPEYTPKFPADRLDREYYNLFVVSNETFETNTFCITKEWVLSNFIDPGIKNEFIKFEQKAIEKLKTFPSLFLPEKIGYDVPEPDLYGYYGTITGIRFQRDVIVIEWQNRGSIAMRKIYDHQEELGIKRNGIISELNRTHWTIKRIPLISVMRDAGIPLFE